MDILKTLGWLALGIVVLAIVLLIFSLIIHGLASISVFLMPWLFRAAWFAFFVCLVPLAPLAAFKATRKISSIGFLICSFVFGLVCWVCGFLVTYSFWGATGVVIGLVIAGVGVVPIGIIAALFHGIWSTAGFLLVLLILTFGSRALALALAARVDGNAENAQLSATHP